MPIFMLNAFSDLLCSKLCWHNMPGPSYIYKYMHLYNTYVYCELTFNKDCGR